MPNFDVTEKSRYSICSAAGWEESQATVSRKLSRLSFRLLGDPLDESRKERGERGKSWGLSNYEERLKTEREPLVRLRKLWLFLNKL